MKHPRIFLFLLAAGLLWTLGGCRSNRSASTNRTEKKQKAERAPSAPQSASREVIRTAEQYLGVKYKFGGMDKKGMDCSGLTCVTFQQAVGIQLPRTSGAQAAVGKPVTSKEARPGDLIFFKGRDLSSKQVGHVGIVVENTGADIRFIHAASTGVRYDFLYGNSYYKPRFTGIRRILDER